MRQYNDFQVLTKRFCVMAVAIASLLLAACANTSKQNTQQDDIPTQFKQQTLTDAELQDSVRSDAPKEYVIKKGDTLWDIAGHFLDHPEYWPKIWQKNKYIKNPDLIYPGDILVLIYEDGQPVIRLKPKIRVEAVHKPIPTLPAKSIQTFVTSPRIVSQRQFNHLSYIAALPDALEMARTGHDVYIRNLDIDLPDTLDIVRPKNKFAQKKGPNGLIMQRIGQLKITRKDQPLSTAKIIHAKQAIKAGDRLMAPRQVQKLANLELTRPEQAVGGQIISLLNTSHMVRQFDSVVINLGAADGLEPGSLLHIYKAPRDAIDPVTKRRLILPNEQAGVLVVTETQQHLSTALILISEQAIQRKDIVVR